MASLVCSRLMHLAARLQQAPASRAPLRHFKGATQREVRACTAAPTPGNPAVMRKFAALQQGVEELGEEDDFVSNSNGDSATEGDWKGPEFAEASSSDTRTASSRTASTSAGVNYLSVKKAEYVSSATKLSACPAPLLPEFAVIGRSNVGKSSLINMLTKNKKLALTSKQPGKTKCINHFLINGGWYLVDLPGYGYARTSKATQLAWNTFTKEYFLERESLLCVLLLIDGSIPPQQVDIECASWLADAQVPFAVVFTKVDKKKKKGPRVQDNVSAFLASLDALLGSVPDAFVTSAAEGQGGKDLLRHLSELAQRPPEVEEAADGA